MTGTDPEDGPGSGRRGDPVDGLRTGPVEAVASRCGCAGKTPLSRVVRPALAALRARSAGVDVAGDLEAGLLPNTTALERSVVAPDARAPPVAPRAEPNASLSATEPEGCDGSATPRFVAAAFVDAERGADPAAFGECLGEAYRAWARDCRGPMTRDGRDRAGEEAASPTDATDRSGRGRPTVVKGHSIQLEGASEPTIWGERLIPAGRRRPGYRAVNVDVVHAFPGLDPERQAAVATVHALNDCYTQGAAADRDVRPIVAVPAGTDLDRDRVRRWYRAAVPASVRVREPAIVAHDGRGWQFGAAATAATDRIPPVRRGAIEPGDEVTVHRPLGGLALYAGSLARRAPAVTGRSSSDGAARSASDGTARSASDTSECAGSDGRTRSRAVEALTTDHVAVARAIAASCPAPTEPFDPDRHLKWVCDLSGPGIRGLLDATEREGCGLSIEGLPWLDREGVEAVRDRWVVPDATVETNGPLAAIGSPAALERFERRLADVPSADPSRIGRVTGEATLRWADGVDLERFVEDLLRRKRP